MTKKIILYYAEWCGFCQRFKPVWKEFKKKIDKEYPDIEAVEFEQKNVPSRALKDIEGWPTIIIHKNGKKYNYVGERTVEALLSTLNSDDHEDNLQEMSKEQKGGSYKDDNYYRQKYIKYKKKYMRIRNRRI